MSYDVYLEIDTGDTEPTKVVDVGNYTWNVSPMYVKAMGHTLGEMNGQRADVAAAVLNLALTEMEAHPDEYKALNPPNGWGDCEGAIWFLRCIFEACRRHPKTTLRIF